MEESEKYEGGIEQAPKGNNPELLTVPDSNAARESLLAEAEAFPSVGIAQAELLRMQSEEDELREMFEPEISVADLNERFQDSGMRVVKSGESFFLAPGDATAEEMDDVILSPAVFDVSDDMDPRLKNLILVEKNIKAAKVKK